MDKKAFQILQMISDHMPTYESALWLATPNPQLDGKSPYEMIKKSRPERVRVEAERYIKELKIKKKRRGRK
tara:strand:- start:944 stop:1156 length:213 start_codon:yes stop_codon:yes gene_type:complete